MVLRQRDANTLWRDASDGTLEERRYLCQNWRHDVCAVLTDTGKMVETMTYSAYGIPIARPAGDTDSDGDWDATDSAAITGSYDARKDADQNGSVAAADVTHANSITGGYQTLGRGVLSSASVVNRRGYAGYEFEPVLLGAKHHVRNRVLDSETGRWTRRDPLGYVDGMGIYEYVGGTPCVRLDATGLHFVQVERSPWGTPIDFHSTFPESRVASSTNWRLKARNVTCPSSWESVWLVQQFDLDVTESPCSGTTMTGQYLSFYEAMPMTKKAGSNDWEVVDRGGYSLVYRRGGQGVVSTKTATLRPRYYCDSDMILTGEHPLWGGGWTSPATYRFDVDALETRHYFRKTTPAFWGAHGTGWHQELLRCDSCFSGTASVAFSWNTGTQLRHETFGMSISRSVVN